MTFPFASTNCNKVGTELDEPLSNLNYLNPNPETNTFTAFLIYTRKTRIIYLNKPQIENNDLPE